MFVKRQDLERVRSLLGNVFESNEEETSLVESREEQKLLPFLERQFFYAGLNRKDQKTSIAFITGASLVLIFLGIITGVKFFFLLIPIPFLILAGKLKNKSRQRALNFERDFPALLLSLASSVKTGMDPLIALLKAHKLFSVDSQMKMELYRLKKSIDFGDTEEKAILNFASSIKHPDIELFRTAFILARKEGGSLAESLRRLAKVTRQRQSFRRKTRGAVAMQKLSSWGIGGSAVIIAMIQVNANPKAFMETVNHPVGGKMLVIGVILMAVGISWMLNMTKSKI